MQPIAMIWPDIEEAYMGEFGPVNPEVHRAAGERWPQAEKLAERILNDPEEGFRLMQKAVALVSRVLTTQPAGISNLPAYIYSTYKHLVLYELEKANGHRRLEADRLADLQPTTIPENEEESLNQKILLNELELRMDNWTREVFQMRKLGYGYKELVPQYGPAANAIRSKLSKNLRDLALRVQRDMEEAEQKSQAG